MPVPELANEWAPWLEVARVAPPYLNLLLIVVLLVIYRNETRQLFQRLTSFKGLGVEIDFAKAAMGEAVETGRRLENEMIRQGQKRGKARTTEIPKSDQKKALARANASLSVLRGRRVLWVDDIPSNNLAERRMLRILGVATESATSTQEAIRTLSRDESQFDLVITDMERDGEKTAGLDFINQYCTMVETRVAPDHQVLPIIVYLFDYNENLGTPRGAFGITDRPDRLLHLVIDVLARESTAF